MLHFALIYLQIFEVDMKSGRIDVEGEGERDSFLLRYLFLWSKLQCYAAVLWCKQCESVHISCFNSSLFLPTFALDVKMLFLRLYQVKQGT